MIILKILLIIIAAVLSLICLLLITKISLCVKYKDELCIYLKIWFIYINLTKARRKNKRHKIQRLSDYLKEQNKDGEKFGKTTVNSTAMSAESAEKSTAGAENTVSGSKEKKADASQKGQDNKQNSTSPTDKPSIFDTLKHSTSGMKINDIIKLIVKLLESTLNPFSRYAKIKLKSLKITVSCEDAADTAILFGLTNGAVSSLLAFLDSFDRVKIPKSAVGVYTDFLSGQTKALIDIRLSIFVWQAIICVFKPFLKYIGFDSKVGKEE